MHVFRSLEDTTSMFVDIYVCFMVYKIQFSIWMRFQMDCRVVIQWPLHRDLIFVMYSEKKSFSVFDYVQCVVPVMKNKCICECIKLNISLTYAG
jgi:hypothetical protein